MQGHPELPPSDPHHPQAGAETCWHGAPPASVLHPGDPLAAATSQHREVMGISKLWPPSDASATSNGAREHAAACAYPEPG